MGDSWKRCLEGIFILQENPGSSYQSVDTKKKMKWEEKESGRGRSWARSLYEETVGGGPFQKSKSVSGQKIKPKKTASRCL